MSCGSYVLAISVDIISLAVPFTLPQPTITNARKTNNYKGGLRPRQITPSGRKYVQEGLLLALLVQHFFHERSQNALGQCLFELWLQL